MTTTVRITNEGPERAMVTYYDEARQFDRQRDVLKPGESIVVNVWNGRVPVIQAIHGADDSIPNGSSFYGVPPAHY